MKRFLAITVTALIILTAVAVPAFAYSRAQKTSYADTDSDGICDNRDASGKCQYKADSGKGGNFVDSDSDGICDNRDASGKCQYKADSGKGANFVDSDNDGICDNRDASGKCHNGANASRNARCGKNR